MCIRSDTSPRYIITNKIEMNLSVAFLLAISIASELAWGRPATNFEAASLPVLPESAGLRQPKAAKTSVGWLFAPGWGRFLNPSPWSVNAYRGPE